MGFIPEVYPEYEWIPWKFANLPKVQLVSTRPTEHSRGWPRSHDIIIWRIIFALIFLIQGFWDDMGNQKAYMSWLSAKLGRPEGQPDAWYDVSREQFIWNDGGTLLKRYDGSFYRLFTKLYPDKDWYPWLFKKIPTGLWKQKENQRKFLDWLAKKVGVAKSEDWYKVTTDLVVESGGSQLLAEYNSFAALLTAVYAQEFLPWKFRKLPNDFWMKLENRKVYIEWLKKKLKLLSTDSLKRKDLLENDGVGLLGAFGGSLAKVLHSLDSANSSPKKKYTWDSLEEQKDFVDALGKTLGVQGDVAHWYTSAPYLVPVMSL